MRLGDAIAGVEGEAWCIFDITAAGAASGQALDLVARFHLHRLILRIHPRSPGPRP